LNEPKKTSCLSNSRAEDTFRDVTDARKSVHVFVSLGVWEFDTWIGSKLQEEYLLLVKDAAFFYLATLDVGAYYFLKYIIIFFYYFYYYNFKINKNINLIPF